MRLIDADANRENFKKIVCRTLNDCGTTSKEKFNLIMSAFDNMPTAYNVEKVVEELEEARKECVKLQKTTTDAYGYMKMKNGIDIALYIIRKGGVE